MFYVNIFEIFPLPVCEFCWWGKWISCQKKNFPQRFSCQTLPLSHVCKEGKREPLIRSETWSEKKVYETQSVFMSKAVSHNACEFFSIFHEQTPNFNPKSKSIKSDFSFTFAPRNSHSSRSTRLVCAFFSTRLQTSVEMCFENKYLQ